MEETIHMKQTLKYIYNLVYENMKFAETKHSIILTLSGAVIAFSTTFFSANIKQNLFAIASIILSLISILYSFVALISRNIHTKKRKIDVNDNLLFYKDIMHYDGKSYIDSIKKKYNFTNIYKADKMDFDLASEIITTSKLAYLKYLYFNFAVLFLFVSIICLISTVLIRGAII